ncbi:uncharacterized protein SPPG_04421 [Spizellomyces punctatus DAOM BR117]|uniref:F-BAR domain-containing protein n=1 Tax=Spizellomyces punctatus (strain DAOM BR117) TaxID=645134 RepID=A0A0L0HH22_SPIPD|nr:uncharacterized protein SPPG_04421 [Spizellomyces punctatus DAOM BR117]KND00079.1 hypothetical protein SPPG_04421 [Spizellomyces punctatus DAOM BR117]|eukprot:XP_016608118.1 hypothetical protein SPPG_04421 [Spizellomyces punctatus DAOM BR117]
MDDQPNFGLTLWDQLENVEAYTKIGTQSLERFNEFLKRRAEIEADYARSLQKLVKAHKEELNKKEGQGSGNKGLGVAVLSGTVAQSWLQLLTMTEHTATFHTSMAENMDTDLRKSIKNQIKENDKVFKQHFDDLRKYTLDYRKVVDNLEKTRQKYDKATKDMDAARQAYESANQDMNKTAKDIEKLRTEAEKKAMLAQEAATGYKQCIEQTNIAKEKYYTETIPSVLNIIQSKDEQNRIDFSKNAFLKYSGLLASQMPSLTTALENMVDMFEKITPSYDSATFIKMTQTHSPYPADFTFEERALATSNLNKKTSTRGFTKTRDEIDDNKEDAIVVLPGKQGRKKALERIKVLDKELAEVEKKRTGVDTLMAVYASKPEIAKDPKVQRDLDDQHQALDQRIALILHKKHKLQVYISTLDGVAPPDPPAVQIGGKAYGQGQSSPLTPFSDSSSVGSGTPVSAARPLSVHTTKSEGSSGGLIPQSSIVESPRATEVEERSHHGSSHQLASSHDHDSNHDGNTSVICRVKLMYDFEGNADNNELCVKAGEEVDVLEKQDDGWWKARVHRPDGNLEGFIPGNYTEEI